VKFVKIPFFQPKLDCLSGVGVSKVSGKFGAAPLVMGSDGQDLFRDLREQE
jgi:hypothetical protein